MRSLTIDRSKGKPPESPRHFWKQEMQKNSEQNQIFEAHYPPDTICILIFLHNLIATAFSSKNADIFLTLLNYVTTISRVLM